MAPPKPSPQLSTALTRAVVVAFAVLAAMALVYAAFAVVSRRGIFVALATDPASVTRDAAERSDSLNLTLFLVAGLVLVVAAALLVAWLIRATRALRRSPLPIGWWAVAGGGIVVVVAALAVHTSAAPTTIAVGYLILGAGAIVIAAAAVWGAVLVVRAARPAPVPPAAPALPPFNPHGPLTSR